MLEVYLTMFPIIVGKIYEKDLSEELALTELEHRKPQLYRLQKILDCAMGIYSLPVQVLENILMPYLRFSPKKAQAFARMELSKAEVDLKFWGPILLEDGNPIALYYEILKDWHTANVTEDQWNVFVADFSNSLLRNHLEDVKSDRSELLLDNNANITDLDPVVIFRGLRQLDAHRTKIHDLSPLGELARRSPLLQHLNLSFTRISDLEPLRGFVSLHFFKISQCIYVQDLEPISGMEKLEILHIDGTRVSCLESVPLASLRYLNAAHTRVHDLSPLANSQISALSLTGCKRIPQSGISLYLSSLNLVELSLSETGLKSRYLDTWPQRWSELTMLRLDDCPHLTSLPSLKKMWKLTELSISNTVINSLEPLRDLNLRKLCLNGSTFPSLSPVSFSNIEEILLSGARFKLGPLNLPCLNALDISKTKGRCILILNSLKYSPIARLDLSHTSIVNLWSIRNFSETLRQLVLSFTPVHNISLLSKCHLLFSLNLSYTKVNDPYGMHWVANHLHSLEQINLEGTSLHHLVNEILHTSYRARRIQEEAAAQAVVDHGDAGGNPEFEEALPDLGGPWDNEIEAEEEDYEGDYNAGHGHENNPEDDDVESTGVAAINFINFGFS